LNEEADILAGFAMLDCDQTRSADRGGGAAAYVGVGYKHEHFDDISRTHPDVGFFEIHAENFMGDGGEPHARLEWLRHDYEISIHGVGLSIAGTDCIDETHLQRVKRLVDRYEPVAFSEHLAWSRAGGAFYSDLLPIPYTRCALNRVVDNVGRVQDALGRKILLENPATYLQFSESIIPETDFLAELVRRTGCGLLLDVANVLVCAANHDFRTRDYLERFPLSAVEEIHLAGFHVDAGSDGQPLLIDSHSAVVSDEVWRLYQGVIARIGRTPTLIEWDNDLPDWSTLLMEAQHAETLMNCRSARGAGTNGARHAAWR
jgi:uncharacterized protein